MKKIKVKVPAKINLTLDVLGVKGGYHAIKSLVTSVSVYDTVTLVKRKDKRITLKGMGLKSGCSVIDNNAFRAARAFKEAYSTSGVDIILDKSIPVGGGMGGSSADIAAVLKGMKALFNPDADIKSIADDLGSDSGYMIDGGWAIISDRGTEIEKLDLDTKLYVLLLTDKAQISSRECYRRFDKLGVYSKECTDIAVKALVSGEVDKFLGVIKNDLFAPAKELVPSVSANLSVLMVAGAKKALMTGSGTVVYGLFTTEKARNAAYKKLYPLYEDRLIKAHTL